MSEEGSRQGLDTDEQSVSEYDDQDQFSDQQQQQQQLDALNEEEYADNNDDGSVPADGTQDASLEGIGSNSEGANSSRGSRPSRTQQQQHQGRRDGDGSDSSARRDAPGGNGQQQEYAADGEADQGFVDGGDNDEEYDDADENDDQQESPETILGTILKQTGRAVGGNDSRRNGDGADDYGDEAAEDPENNADVLAAALSGKDSTSNLENDIEGMQEGEYSILQDMQQTLQQLVDQHLGGDQDQTVARLKVEYDKFHKMFVGSRKNEKMLVKKCRELTAELTANASKVQAALKLSQNDRSTITSLRKEVKKAWKMVEAASEKEARARDVASSLKNEVDGLRGTMTDQGLAPTSSMPSSNNFARNKLLEIQIEQEDQLRKVIKEKQTLEQEFANVLSESRALRVECDDHKEKLTSLMNERVHMDEEMVTLKDLLAAKKSEQDRDIRSREKMEQSLKQALEAYEKRESEMKVKIGEAKILKEQISKIDMQLQNERIRVEKIEKERDQLSSRLTRLQQEYDEQSLTTQRLLNENHEQGRDLKTWEEEMSQLKDSFKMISRIKETLGKKLKASDEAKLNTEVERDALRSTSSHLAHELDSVNKELEGYKKQLEMISRERDIAQKNFVKATGATQKQFNVLKLAEQTQRNLDQEIQSYKDEAQKMRKLIYTLEKDRDNKINEASRLDQIIMAKDEEIKMKDMIIFDSKKKISEFERKLKEQQALYENVRTDRNVYSKNLIESQDEISEMKRKLKIMNHQVEQLKEEIASKEAVLVKEHFEHSKLEKEKETLSIQIGKLQQQYEESQQMIQNQQAEENKLRHIIIEADAERMRQKKEYDAVVQERDILGTQLIRRNDELSLLYEKIKIQTSTLNKGEIQYRERLEDIRVLRLEIKRLRREKAILQTETQNVDSLRNEIFRLQRDVLRERTRVKVLEEELESPMNIHRWRKLAGSDPSSYELINKIQMLQKRLIAKTEEIVEKELVIQQKEKLYKEVKEVLQRQPGPEVVEELRVVREAVKTKIRESKALASELNMYHSQVNEYKYEIERLSRELQELKKKYYQLRKRHQAEKRAEANTLKERVMLPIDMDRLRYTPGAAEAMYALQDEGTAMIGGSGVGAGLHMLKNQQTRSGSVGGATISASGAGVLENSRQGIRANPPSGPKFSGGGFNMSTGPQQIVHLVPEGQQHRQLQMQPSSSPSPSQQPSTQPQSQGQILNTYGLNGNDHESVVSSNGGHRHSSPVDAKTQVNVNTQEPRYVAQSMQTGSRVISNSSSADQIYNGSANQAQNLPRHISQADSNLSGSGIEGSGGSLRESGASDAVLPRLPGADSKELKSTHSSLVQQSTQGSIGALSRAGFSSTSGDT